MPGRRQTKVDALPDDGSPFAKLRGRATRRPTRAKLSRERLTASVRDLALGMGADLFGVAPVERFDGAPAGHHPLDWLPGCRSVVVFALRQLEAGLDWPWMMQGTELATEEDRLAILQDYWSIVENHDVHDSLLNQMALRLALHLQRLGYPSLFHEASTQKGLRELMFARMRVPTPHGLFSHRHAAVRAGLGEFGLNNLVITPEHGPYVRFVSVLTTAELTPSPLLVRKACLGAKCGLCLELCGGEVLLPQPDVEPDAIWLDPPTRTDRAACQAHCAAQFCNAQCVARCPVGRPLRTTRKRLPSEYQSLAGDVTSLPSMRQVQWPPRRAPGPASGSVDGPIQSSRSPRRTRTSEGVEASARRRMRAAKTGPPRSR